MDKPTKYYSNKQESAIANLLGWEVVSGSGARPCTPGDIISDDWLGECKTHTSSNSIFFDLSVWKKIQEEAMIKHRKPALFADDGSQDIKRTWVLCYRSSIVTSGLNVVGTEFSIKKNIKFDCTSGLSYLSGASKESTSLYTCRWDNRDILIMPLLTFKELYTI